MSETLTEVAALPKLHEAIFVNRWIDEAGRSDPLFSLAEGRVEGNASGRVYLRIDNVGRLILGSNDNRPELILAEFVGERRNLHEDAAVLLNGDGLTGVVSALQTRLRDRVHEKIGIRRTLIIPFLALTAAEIDHATIRRIHVSSDINENRRFILGKTPTVNLTEQTRNVRNRIRDGRGQRWVQHLVWEGMFAGRRWRRFLTDGELSWYVAFRAPNGQTNFRVVNTDDEGRPFVIAQVHRLGAAIFSAVGPDQNRHRYISAFDEQENAMYYLAQLPDEGIVRNYEDAIRLLAPPIVHRAQEQGLEIFRQGDVFAIETSLTDKDLRQRNATITRRSSVLIVSGGGAATLDRRIATARRQKVMIHGTGHTATMVAKLPNGATFIKGTLYHDPIIEEPGRRREHRSVPLGDQNKWFLCTRNTVPMQAQPRRERNGKDSST